MEEQESQIALPFSKTVEVAPLTPLHMILLKVNWKEVSWCHVEIYSFTNVCRSDMRMYAPVVVEVKGTPEFHILENCCFFSKLISSTSLNRYYYFEF